VLITHIQTNIIGCSSAINISIYLTVPEIMNQIANPGINYGIPGAPGFSSVVQVPSFQTPNGIGSFTSNQPLSMSYTQQPTQIVPPQMSYVGGPIAVTPMTRVQEKIYSTGSAPGSMPIQPTMQLQNITVPLNETPIHYTPHNWLW
jgi:hypothetical protein